MCFLQNSSRWRRRGTYDLCQKNYLPSSILWLWFLRQRWVATALGSAGQWGGLLATVRAYNLQSLSSAALKLLGLHAVRSGAHSLNVTGHLFTACALWAAYFLNVTRLRAGITNKIVHIKRSGAPLISVTENYTKARRSNRYDVTGCICHLKQLFE